MATDPNRGSEFGGVPGRIQPSPHDPAENASEMLGLIFGTNPAGETSGNRTFVPDSDDPIVPPTVRLR